MAMDLDHMTGAPRDWRFAGRTWQVSGLTPYQLGKLNAYLKDAIPSPVAEVKALLKDGVFTPEERKALLDDARARAEPRYVTHRGRAIQTGGWPVKFGSVDGNELLFNGEGIGTFLFVVLAKHQPELTREKAEGLAPHFSLENLRDLMALISPPSDPADEPDDDDEAPADLPEGYVDPKA